MTITKVTAIFSGLTFRPLATLASKPLPKGNSQVAPERDRIGAQNLLNSNTLIMVHNFKCSVCGEEKTHEDGFTTGYGKDKDGNIVCFACCGEQDKQYLRENGKLHGYFSKGKDGEYYFQNWPGTFRLRARHIRKSWHNFAGKNGRTDFIVTFEGRDYYGAHVGHNNTMATIKAYKK